MEIQKEELVKLLAEVAKTAVGERVKELGLENLDRKFGRLSALANMSDEDVAKMDKKTKVAKFVKAIYQKDMGTLVALKAMTEGTDSAGGFLVPEEWAAELNRIVEDFGLVPKLSTRYRMTSDTMHIPRLSASVTVSYPGEATAGTASQPTLESVTLLAKTVMGITPMSNELLADANVNLVDQLTMLYGEAIAGEADKQGLTGTGSPFTGILGDAGVNVVDAASTQDTYAEAATADNCRDLIAQIKPWALQGAAFIMHRTVWATIQKTKASTGGDYFASAANPILSGTAGQGFPAATAGTLWGYPVYLSDKMPATSDGGSQASKKFIIFGNLKHVFWGLRGEITVDVSREATVGSDNLFAANMSAVRVIQRHAVAVGLPLAFAVLKTSAS